MAYSVPPQPRPSLLSPQVLSAVAWCSETFGHSLSPAQAEPPGGDNPTAPRPHLIGASKIQIYTWEPAPLHRLSQKGDGLSLWPQKELRI